MDISLCGHLIADKSITGGDFILKTFDEYRITYDAFLKRPHEILRDKRLVIRIDEQYYNWETAAPFIISLLAFRQPVPHEIIGQPLVEVQMIKGGGGGSSKKKEGEDEEGREEEEKKSP